MTYYHLTNFIYFISIFHKRASSLYHTSIKLLISATLFPYPPPPLAFSFPDNAAFFLFVNIPCSYKCVSKHLIIRTKVDLSQVSSVVISRKRLCWNYPCLNIVVQCVKDCGPHNCACKYGHKNTDEPLCVSMSVFTQLKPYFNICALIFFNLYGWRIQSTHNEVWINQLNIPSKFGINIFDYEGHNPWHTQ